ncbi:hypothetical protein [Thermus albus]|nr:hypothetical protein [Thermus albus]
MAVRYRFDVEEFERLFPGVKHLELRFGAPTPNEPQRGNLPDESHRS